MSNDGEVAELVGKLAVLTETKQWAKALELHNSFFDSKKAADWYTRANLLTNLGQRKQALECYSNAIGLNPSYAKAWYRKGWLEFSMKDYREAYRSFLGCVVAEDGGHGLSKDNVPTTSLNWNEEIAPDRWKAAAIFSAALALSELRDQSHVQEFVNLMFSVRKILIERNLITDSDYPLESGIKNGALIDMMKQKWSPILDQLEPKTATVNVNMSGTD